MAMSSLQKLTEDLKGLYGFETEILELSRGREAASQSILGSVERIGMYCTKVQPASVSSLKQQKG